MDIFNFSKEEEEETLMKVLEDKQDELSLIKGFGDFEVSPMLFNSLSNTFS